MKVDKSANIIQHKRHEIQVALVNTIELNELAEPENDKLHEKNMDIAVTKHI